jgi:DNA-3-methyladenine glycosylase
MPAHTPRLRRALPRVFYDRDTVAVAQDLLGKALVSRVDGLLTGGMIVETEAYLAVDDPACHAARGRTTRNATMFGPPGRLYVYGIHARHCLNAVTERPGRASAVLIRAVEPLWGVEAMSARRGTDVVRDLARGPARLCEALHVDLAHNGIDLTRRAEVSIHPWFEGHVSVRATPRIGISQATDLMLRFFVDRNPFVSGRAADHSSRPRWPARPTVSDR